VNNLNLDALEKELETQLAKETRLSLTFWLWKISWMDVWREWLRYYKFPAELFRVAMRTTGSLIKAFLRIPFKSPDK